jgi:nucleotide-binding universal stress UspA family protein
MKTILVPIDFSENSINALKYADTLALKLNAGIVVLNIYTGDITNYDAGWPMEESFKNVKEILEKEIQGIAQKYCKSATTILVKEGKVVKEILDSVKETKADLIVMGTHGATGLKRVFLGSNTANLISNSDKPVLAIPENYSFSNIQKIIYATDMHNILSELKIITSIADDLNAAVEVLHLKYESEKDNVAEQKFNQTLSSISYSKIEFVQKTIPVEETLSDALKKYVQNKKNTALAMFSEDKIWIDRIMLNSITDDIAYDLELPLLAMRKV